MAFPRQLWNRQFVLLNVAVCLAFANIAVFFQYYDYLRSLGMDPRWFGVIIGAFSATALVIRPLVSPFLHPGNALRWAASAGVAVVVALLLYGLVRGPWSMLLVRIFHGGAHVVMASALMAALIVHIPKENSGQAFGIISIATLLPYALVPPVVGGLTDRLGGYDHVLWLFGGIMVLMFPLLASAKSGRSTEECATGNSRLRGGEIMDNLKDPRIVLILLAMLFFFSGYALVFFYLSGYGKSVGIAGVGLFFTLSTVGEIGVRFLAGSLFDKTNKAILAAWSLVIVSIGYVLLGNRPSTTVFFSLGLFLGLGWGVIMPVLNGLIFDVSSPRYRPFNTNLGMQMFQGGFFIGPFIGGAILSVAGFQWVFHACAGLGLAAAGMAFLLAGQSCKKEAADGGYSTAA